MNKREITETNLSERPLGEKQSGPRLAKSLVAGTSLCATVSACAMSGPKLPPYLGE